MTKPLNLLFDPVRFEDIEKYEIVKVRETFCQMQICTTIPPEQKHTINDRLKVLGLAESGTSHGWILDEETEPAPCTDFAGRWHYLCNC